MAKIKIPGLGVPIDSEVVSGVRGAVEEVGAEGEPEINKAVAKLMGLVPVLVSKIRNYLELKEKARSTRGSESKE